MTQAQKTAKAKFKQAIAYRQKTGVSLKEAFAHIYGKKVGAVKKKSASKKGYMNLYSKIGDIEKYNGTILGVKIGVKKILGKNKLFDLKIYDVNGNHSIINLYADDKESDIRNDLAPKLYKYIFNTTTQSYTSLQSDVLKKKLFTYLKLLAAELKRLNKKPIKKAVPKKKVAKKVVRKKVAKKKLTKIDYDKRYQAKKPGKRKSASGNTYYESRANRSDKGKMLGINIGNIPTYKDKDAARDVQLFADNDYMLYQQRKRPILINLGKKYKKGTYDINKAAKLWRYYVDAALQKYHKEYGNKGKWYDMLSVADRNLLSLNYAIETKNEFDLGNFTN